MFATFIVLAIILGLSALDFAALRWGVDSRHGLNGNPETAGEWHILS